MAGNTDLDCMYRYPAIILNIKAVLITVTCCINGAVKKGIICTLENRMADKDTSIHAFMGIVSITYPINKPLNKISSPMGARINAIK